MPQFDLTPREEEVARGAMRGSTNQEIADDLGLSVSTVKRQLGNAMLKWRCRNRVELALRAAERLRRFEAEAGLEITEAV